MRIIAGRNPLFPHIYIIQYHSTIIMKLFNFVSINTISVVRISIIISQIFAFCLNSIFVMYSISHYGPIFRDWTVYRYLWIYKLNNFIWSLIIETRVEKMSKRLRKISLRKKDSRTPAAFDGKSNILQRSKSVSFLGKYHIYWMNHTGLILKNRWHIFQVC